MREGLASAEAEPKTVMIDATYLKAHRARSAEAKVLIEAWRRRYNTVRPHSSLGYRPPAPEAATPPLPASGSASLHLRPAMAAEVTMH
jgi:transposase InsO family protein